MNSGIVILFLTGAVIAFVVRVLKKDVARSNQLKDSVSIRVETGYLMIS